MPIKKTFAFLVHPGKGIATALAINGAEVQRTGRLFNLLEGIYVRTDQECDIEITFASTNGAQQNDCRDLICKFIRRPNLKNGAAIASRLQIHSDGRSGLGLLFLIVGNEAAGSRIVLSRFPTDNAIYVQENSKAALTVQFLERVFMKNKTSYKAVCYEGSVKGGLWEGKAVDKQQNNSRGESSDYWITDFLASELKLTPARGTKRFGDAIVAAVKKAPLPVKQELTAVAELVPNLNGQTLSIDDIANRFFLSQEATEAIYREIKYPALAKERFRFDHNEFKRVATYKSVELDNGGILTAHADDFNDVFDRRILSQKDGTVQFTTEGIVVNERYKKKY